MKAIRAASRSTSTTPVSAGSTLAPKDSTMALVPPTVASSHVPSASACSFARAQKLVPVFAGKSCTRPRRAPASRNIMA